MIQHTNINIECKNEYTCTHASDETINYTVKAIHTSTNEENSSVYLIIM